MAWTGGGREGDGESVGFGGGGEASGSGGGGDDGDDDGGGDTASISAGRVHVVSRVFVFQ